MLIHLLTEVKQFKNAISIQKQAETIIRNREINPRDLADFYLVLIRLYKLTGNKNIASNYENLYQRNLTELKNNGQQ
jgi:hypothetical protein